MSFNGLCELTAGELHDLLVKKQVTSEEITKAHIERIEARDSEINAFLSVDFENALSMARAVDAKISRGEAITPIEGLPVALKDNLCTVGIKTTCGSKALEHFTPSRDAEVVTRIKERGGIILGKTNMDEFAMGSSTETSRFKQTKNPRDLTRSPGGSSGGSAAAVGAGMAAYALGSDTGGSVRQPASFCGVVGLKPTYGLIPARGCIPLAPSFDQIGLLTKDVADCAAVLGAVAVNYKGALSRDIRGLKIGVATDFSADGISDGVKRRVLAATDTFKSLGCDIGEYKAYAPDHAITAYYIMSCAEASVSLARFDTAECGAEVRRRLEAGARATSKGYYDTYYKEAQRIRELICGDFETQFQKFDLLLSPTTLNTAFRLGEVSCPREMRLNDLCLVSANMAGLPAISVPSGFDGENLPVGLHLIAPAFGEETLLNAAYALEKSRTN